MFWKNKAGKEFIVLLLCRVLALGLLCTHFLSQGNSVDVISSPWKNIFCKALPSFPTIYLALLQLKCNSNFLRLTFPNLLLSHHLISLHHHHACQRTIPSVFYASLSCNSFFQKTFLSLELSTHYEINYLICVLILECNLFKKRNSICFLPCSYPLNLEQCLSCSRHSQMFTEGGLTVIPCNSHGVHMPRVIHTLGIRQQNRDYKLL